MSVVAFAPIPDWRQNIGRLPSYMQEAMLNWIEFGIRPGGFLTALLENDLLRTFEKADDTNIKLIHEYLIYLYNYAPAQCSGSPEKVKNWKGLHQC